MLTRRDVLSVTGAIATAGCSSVTGFSTTSPDRTTDTPTETAVFTDRGRSEIPIGGHKAFDFTPESELGHEVYYDVGVVSDGVIDILTLDWEDYEAYTSGDVFSHHPGLSALGVHSERRKREVSPGRHVIVFDNTDVLTDSTQDVIVEYTIRISRN